MSRHQQQIRTSARAVLSFVFGSFLLAATPCATAQNDGVNGPPNVLVIQREFLKPGKGGPTHDQSERAFVDAMTKAKSTSYYFAMDSLSGPSRSLFFQAYPSFEAWEKDSSAIRKNTAFSSELSHATLMDGELLANYDQAVFTLHPEMSLNMGGLTGVRYMEIMRFDLNPGHVQEWEELVKMYVDGYKKNVPEARWDMFEMRYGIREGNTFLVLMPMKSLRETDAGMNDSKKFAEGMSPEALKRVTELTRIAVKSSMANLYEFNPANSYPPPAWIQAEPDFWKVQPPQKQKK